MEFIFWNLALLILGLLMALKPDLLWKLEHFFSTEGGRPTERYRNLMILGGVLFILAALVMFILSLIL